MQIGLHKEFLMLTYQELDLCQSEKKRLMKFKKRSLAKTFKNTSFRLFALQPSTGKMIKR